MKKKLLLLAAILSVGSFATYGTLAYFAASENVKNTITAGKVDITLHNDCPEDGMKGVMPNQTVENQVYVTNKDANPCWVRVKVTKNLIPVDTASDSDATRSDADRDEADRYVFLKTETGENPVEDIDEVNEADWLDGGDGWYYYKEIVGTGDETTHLFDAVAISGKMGNEYQRATVKIDVEAQAVQSAHNGDGETPNVLDAKGWPESMAQE